MPRKPKVKITWRKSAPEPMFKLMKVVNDYFVLYVALFPDPPIKLVDFLAIMNELFTAFGLRKDGVAAKDRLTKAAIAADEILRKFAEYVDGIANGDVSVINKSGFEPTKVNATKETVVPEIASAVTASVEKGGILHLTTPAIAGATSCTYLIFKGKPFAVNITGQYIEIPEKTDSKLLIVAGGTLRQTLNGFAPGTELNIQVLGKNSVGFGPISPAVQVFTI